MFIFHDIMEDTVTKILNSNIYGKQARQFHSILKLKLKAPVNC